ncbi:MAG: hypothetical protein ACYC3I_06580 [Gemmataceae bacterium]
MHLKAILTHGFLNSDAEQHLDTNLSAGVGVCNAFLSSAFRIRAEVCEGLGEYARALANYGAASLLDRDDSLLEKTQDLHRAIELFFDPSLATKDPWPRDGYARELADNMTVPDGYYIVGGGNILARYALTEDKSQVAIAEADVVAHDVELRWSLWEDRIPDAYTFVTVVYRCENRVATEVYRALSIGADETPQP